MNMQRTRLEQLDMCRRDALMLRHDWARAYGQDGRDAVTRELDTAIVGMVTEIRASEDVVTHALNKALDELRKALPSRQLTEERPRQFCTGRDCTADHGEGEA